MQTLGRSQQTLLAQWIVATIVGWAVGFYVCEAIQRIIRTLFTDGLIIGTGIGLARWIVLRRRIGPIGGWVPASIVGFGGGRALAQMAIQAAPGLPGLVSSAIAGVLIGVAVGVLQGLVLRRHRSGDLRWVVANVLGWGLGWIVIASAGESSDASIVVAYLVGALGAGIAALSTGFVLATDLDRRTA